MDQILAARLAPDHCIHAQTLNPEPPNPRALKPWIRMAPGALQADWSADLAAPAPPPRAAAVPSANGWPPLQLRLPAVDHRACDSVWGYIPGRTDTTHRMTRQLHQTALGSEQELTLLCSCCVTISCACCSPRARSVSSVDRFSAFCRACRSMVRTASVSADDAGMECVLENGLIGVCWLCMQCSTVCRTSAQ